MGNYIKTLQGSIRKVASNPPLFQVYLSRNGNRFFITKDPNGRPLRTENEAKRLLILLDKDSPIVPEMFTRDHSLDFDKAIKKWVAHSICSLEWKDKRKRIVENTFIPYFKKKAIKDFNDNDIAKFVLHLQSKGLKAKTIKNLLGELKQFFTSNRKTIPPEKMPAFPKIKVQRSPIKALAKEEQDQVFEFIEPHNIPVFTFMRFTACRPSEAGALQKRSIDIKGTSFVIENALGKGRRLKDTTKTKMARPLPLIPELLEVVKPLMGKPSDFVFLTKAGNPYTTTRLERIWRVASRKANKKYGTKIVNLYNGLKHSFGVQRLDEGFNLDEIKEVMGHADSQTTRRYAEYSNRRRGKVMRGASQEFHSGYNQKKSNDINKKWSGREDLNLRHLTPHASALPGCATPRR